MSKIDLSQEGLRKRLHDIVANLLNRPDRFNDLNGNLQQLATAVEQGDTYLIETRLMNSIYQTEIIKGFFTDFPRGENISFGILRYQKSTKQAILRAVGNVLYYTQDLDTVYRIVKLAGKSRNRKRDLDRIANAACLFENANVVRNLADNYLRRYG